jgi:hypothetical protein
MDEAKQTNHADDAGTAASGVAARREEATSSDTLSDLRQTQNASPAAQEGGADGSSDSASAPSPDGAPDNASGGTADGKDSGGPM